MTYDSMAWRSWSNGIKLDSITFLSQFPLHTCVTAGRVTKYRYTGGLVGLRRRLDWCCEHITACFPLATDRGFPNLRVYLVATQRTLLYGRRTQMSFPIVISGRTNGTEIESRKLK